ncbi:hypothetical protein [Bartonella heixiaziensis]
MAPISEFADGKVEGEMNGGGDRVCAQAATLTRSLCCSFREIGWFVV